MDDGIYRAQFETPIGSGSGVAVIRDGVVEGGDCWYWWRGELDVTGEKISAELLVKQHTSGNSSVFGHFDEFKLLLIGESVADGYQFEGSTGAAPGAKMHLNLRLLKSY